MAATPSPRKYPFVASVKDQAYLWGGEGDAEPGAVFIYSEKTKTWATKLTKGQHPPAGLNDGACCIADRHFYLYGGLVGSSRHGALFQLNMEDWSWKKLSNYSPAGPGKRKGCRMIAYKHNLLVVGGYYGFYEAPSYTIYGDANDVYSYSLATGQWSSPSMNGARLHPCDNFSLTMIDEDQAVMFGGVAPSGRCSDARVLYLPTMTWRVFQHKEGDPWPDTRYRHIATCLGYGGQHKTVLISGGDVYGLGYGPIDDLWLLDVESGRFEEVRVENKEMLKRWGHGAAALSVSSECVQVILCGGSDRDSMIADTTVLGFELRPLSGGVSAKRKWFCTGCESADELVKMKQRVTRVVVSDSVASQSFQPVEEPHTTNTASETTRDTDHDEAEDLSADVPEVSAITSSELPTATESTSREENTQSGEKRDGVGGDEQSFVSDVVQAVDQNQQIERKMANIILKGLPEAGKSSLLNRLLNKPFQHTSSSTGLSDGIVVVDIQPTSTLTSVTACDNSSWEVIDFNTSMYSQLDRFKQFLPSAEEESIAIEEGASNTTPVYQVYSVSSISEVPDSIKKVLSAYNIKNIGDLKKKNSLYIRDTGGQVEFQESLTLLIYGPSIFIFVLRTDVDLLKKTIIRYRSTCGDIVNEYQSSISSKDALVQFLTSVCAIETTEEGVFQKGGVYEAHEPVVFIVGTHIDQLGSRANSIITEMNKSLDKVIRKHNFSNVVRYADACSKRVMYTVDNTSEKDPNFRNIRSDVNTYISDRNEFTVKYPVSYLILCLELQRIKVAVLKMDKFVHLASKFGISSDKINHLLHFLQFRIGIIQHYDVDHLSEIVIKEPQVLFNKVTDLLVKTFLSGSMKMNQRASFCEKGILEVSVLENLMDKSKDTITTEQFLAFLVHLRLAVPFTDRNGILKYFIPSVLNHVQSSVCEERKTDIAPLAICFQLGHCPQGLFGILISHLLSSEEIHSKISFDLSDDKIYQDQVTLLVNSCEDVDEISLKKHLSHIEVTMFLESASSDIESESLVALRKNKVCTAVCSILKDCLQLSLKTLHYNSKTVKPMLCLACSSQNCSAMHEVKWGREACCMHCNFSKAKCVIPQSGMHWFSEAPGVVDTGAMKTMESSSKENSKDRESSDDRETAAAKLTDSDDASKNSLPLSQATSWKSVVEFNLHHLTVLKWTDSDGQRHSLRLRNEMSSRWRDVGDLLEVESSHMEGMDAHRRGDMRLCCRDVFVDWLQMEEPSYPANWEGLLLLLEDLELNKMAKKLITALDFIKKSSC